MEKIENGKLEFYQNTKDMIQIISRKCKDINRLFPTLTIDSSFVVPGYKIDGYHLIPERLYVYKIYKSKDSDFKSLNPLPKSKIIICTDSIPKDSLLSYAIHMNLDHNSRNLDYIIMVKEQNGKKKIEIKARRLKSGINEKYVICKDKGNISDKNLYTITYDTYKNDNLSNDNESVYLQRCLNKIIPNRRIANTLDTITNQIEEIRKSLGESNGSNPQLLFWLNRFADRLSRFCDGSYLEDK